MNAVSRFSVCAAICASVWLCGAILPSGALGLPAELAVGLPPPGSDSWQPLTFRSISRKTEYSRESLDGVDSVVAVSNCAASGLVLPLQGIELEATPILSWRWRVVRGLDIPDERTRNGDDFAARVYVLFHPDPVRTSMFARWRRRLGNTLYGREAPGSALNFVWTSREDPGNAWPNPFAADARMIALARGTASAWRSENVNVIDHYREQFDAPLPPLMGLAVMSDSDNSCQSASAHFADFSFRARTSGTDDAESDDDD